MDDQRVDPALESSADLRHVYDDEYYTKQMAGHHLFDTDQLTLQELTNVRRAYALMLNPAPRRITDLGAGRGELARHLLARNIAVTVLDYSPAAIAIAKEHVGSYPNATFIVADAADLSGHVPPDSQDAIFMTDVVEHISSSELRRIFKSCHECLAPEGVLVIHTPEKHYGSVITTAAVHRYHINLFEIASLRALLAECFEFVDAFTWNGFERFQERGQAIELFAYARKRPYRHKPVELDASRVSAGGGSANWVSAVLAPDTSVPLRFGMRATLHVVSAPPDAIIQFVFGTSVATQYLWTGFLAGHLIHNPACLQLASELTVSVGGPSWEDVRRITLRVRAPHGEPFDVRIDDVRLSVHSV